MKNYLTSKSLVALDAPNLLHKQNMLKAFTIASLWVLALLGSNTTVFAQLIPNNKIVVQNGVDGGPNRGLFMWTAGDSNWGIYMGQAGAGKSLSGGTAVAGHNFSSHSIRFRVYNQNTRGFIWENTSGHNLMSLNGGNGSLYVRGKVGINTTKINSSYHLFVNGGIRTTKVRCDTPGGWADYVFATDYQLKPLTEVAAFIQKNQHLPGVPSAAVVAKEGIDLAEMHKIQMAKIEELVLYTLQQQKEIVDLKAKNADLAKRLNKLEKK